MNTRNKLALTALAAAVLCLTQQAQAQQTETPASASAAPAAPLASKGDTSSSEVAQIIVTGVASGLAKRKIDSAFAITTANEEQMKQSNALSTADLMKISPGVYVESSGGQTGANIQIRGFPSGGDAPYVTLQLNGSPLFPAPTLSFLANDSTFRIDDTVERVEILRGGPSVILSNGQPGATMNFIMKKGDDTPEGSLRATVGSGRLMRYDAFFAGKLADGWYGTLGGFYRSNNGVRSAGFPADDGGAFSASLTHRMSDGEFTFYLRKTDDKNAFYTGLPVLLTPTGQLSAFPGVDPLSWTPMSNQTRLFTLPDGTKGDLADGRGAQNVVLGFDFNQKINGWNVNNKMNFFKGDQNTVGMFSGPNPVSFGAQLDSLIGNANGNAAALAAAGRAATGGSGVYVDDGSAVSSTMQTIGMAPWIVGKKLQNFTDELRVTKEIVPNHSLTLGAYAAQYSSNDVWDIGGNMLLMDINRRPIKVTLNNGVLATDAQGFMSGCGFCIAENGNTSNRALYAADEWKINAELTLDAGARYETQNTTLAFQSPTFGNKIGSNPLALYQYGIAQPNGPVFAYDEKWNLASFTIGGLYKLQKDMSVFVRANSGGQFPFFDQIRGSAASLPPPVTKIKQFEVGFKTAGPRYNATVGLFANRLSDQFLGQSSAAGLPINTVGGSKTYGIEYEVLVRPFQYAELLMTGNAQHARYEGYDDKASPGINGRIVQRQPSGQFRLTPSYRVPLGDNTLKLYATYSKVNGRYSDQQNTQYLPSYKTLDAGALLLLGDKLELRLSATNLTNELGLTEGSASRGVVVPGGVPFVSIDRPLFGREVQLSLAYRF